VLQKYALHFFQGLLLKFIRLTNGTQVCIFIGWFRMCPFFIIFLLWLRFFPLAGGFSLWFLSIYRDILELLVWVSIELGVEHLRGLFLRVLRVRSRGLILSQTLLKNHARESLLNLFGTLFFNTANTLLLVRFWTFLNFVFFVHLILNFKF
jgi:hypothetical protein